MVFPAVPHPIRYAFVIIASVKNNSGRITITLFGHFIDYHYISFWQVILNLKPKHVLFRRQKRQLPIRSPSKTIACQVTSFTLL